MGSARRKKILRRGAEDVAAARKSLRGDRVLAGTRIRQARLDRGIRQVELARGSGISPSYLNLIEHNRRPIGGALLGRIAGILGVPPRRLSDGPDADLAAELRAAGARLGAAPAEMDRAEEIVTRFPSVAALVAAQARRIATLEGALRDLDDRLAHDPRLSEALYDVLSAASAVGATSAILSEKDVGAAWRERFGRNLREDAARLADGVRALAARLESRGGAVESPTPQEEVEAWLDVCRWHLPPIEEDPNDAALRERLAEEAQGLSSEAAREAARAHLARYAADCRALPLEILEEAGADGLAEPARLAAEAGCDLATVLRRLATRPDGPATGLVICDQTGTTILRKRLADVPLPRAAGGCGMLPLYGALTQPNRPIRTYLRMPGADARAHLAYAVAVPRSPMSFDGPTVLDAVMLVTPAQPGRPAEGARPVGPNCRVCPRADCPARREPGVPAPTPTG